MKGSTSAISQKITQHEQILSIQWFLIERQVSHKMYHEFTLTKQYPPKLQIGNQDP